MSKIYQPNRNSVSNREKPKNRTIRNFLLGSKSQSKNRTFRNWFFGNNVNKSQSIPKVIKDKVSYLEYLKNLQNNKRNDIEVEKQEKEGYIKEINSLIIPIKKHNDAIINNNENEKLDEAEKDDYEMQVGILAIKIRYSDKRIERYEKELESYDDQIEKEIKEIEKEKIEKEKEIKEIEIEKERLQRKSPIKYEDNPYNNNFEKGKNT